MRYANGASRSSSPIVTFLSGALAGGGLAYVLDPAQGARRRAISRDKITHLVTRSQRNGRGALIDFRNRATGWAHKITSLLLAKPASPQVLTARVWAHVGGLVSHPRALTITAQTNGTVCVEGPILAGEVDDLLDAILWVPGVSGIDNRLRPHQRPEGIPALQGGALRRSALFRLHDRRYWAPAQRLLAGALGTAIAGYGLSQSHRLRGRLCLGLGGALLLRSLSNMELARFFGLRLDRRLVDIAKTLTIQRPRQEVFGLWTDFRRLPRVLDHVFRIEELGGGRYRWKVAGLAGSTITWDTQIVRLEPEELIAWRTVPGSTVAGAGLIRFEALNDHATRLDINMSYDPPGGMLGHAFALLAGIDPKHLMDDDLVRLKSFLEAGRTRAHGQRITADADPRPQARPQ